jgi:hypothetical protein
MEMVVSQERNHAVTEEDAPFVLGDLGEPAVDVGSVVGCDRDAEFGGELSRYDDDQHNAAGVFAGADQEGIWV